MDFAVVAPYLGLVAALALAVWQARARGGNDISIDAGESLLRQYEAQSRELRSAQRDCRKAEQAYRDVVAWGIQVLQQVAREAPGVKLPPMPSRPINGEGHGQDLPPMSDRDEVRLRKLLVERMQAEDLKTLAFDLGLEEMQGTTPREMARSLLDLVRSRHKSAELLKWLADNRPDIQT